MCLIQQSKIVGKNGAIFPQCINSYMLLMVRFTHPLKMAGGRNREQSASRQSMTPFTIYILKCAMNQSDPLLYYKMIMRMNFYNHHNSISFKSHSISVTFRFCAVLVALRALEPRSTDSLGTQHCANFESHSNRVTFETNAIMVIVKVHPLYQVYRSCTSKFEHLCTKLKEEIQTGSV